MFGAAAARGRLCADIRLLRFRLAEGPEVAPHLAEEALEAVRRHVAERGRLTIADVVVSGEFETRVLEIVLPGEWGSGALGGLDCGLPIGGPWDLQHRRAQGA